MRESSRGWEAKEAEGEETLPSGLGAPTFATSHCGIAGARNRLLVYVIFFFFLRKKQTLFKILKVLPFLPQTLKKRFDVGSPPHFSLSSKGQSLGNF